MKNALATLRKFKRRTMRSLTAHLEHRVLMRWFRSAPPTGIILDIGGGVSPYSRYLSADTHIINLDIERNESTSVVADAHHLPFASESLDGVICTNVLEHLRNPQECLVQISRVLRSGGDFIVIVPFMYPMHPNPEDHWRFTWQCLERMFAERFEIIDKVACGGRFAVIWEILGQIRVLEIIRIINPLLAQLPFFDRDYALGYCYRLRRKP